MATTPRLSLPRVSDRIGILVFEHARIRRAGNTITAQTSDGTYTVPIATLTAILAGPGTSITHDAATLIADCGVTVCWTGSGGIRAYSTITPLAVSADLLHHHIHAWADPDQRLAAAYRAYRLRFDDDTAGLNIVELRALEGRRMKTAYQQAADRYGITWTRRVAQWEDADPVNRAITAAYHGLYGAAANVIAALGCHPSLGFIHTGKRDAFVYDLADIYKPTIGLDIAFSHAADLIPEKAIRTALNQTLRENHLLALMVRHLYTIVGVTEPDAEVIYLDDLSLYDPDLGQVPARKNWAH
ncbi:type I-E CRISPR-associated endonuclease Cas1e [Gordonia sihwensis]|uniref:type I-E CRISPR-associated endonuclease Cas1e n=1 Tax=Gordonia sihwensis TaxID=173559 RepID=UPI00061F6133|nr:type I-E CRISPR-associated endonuclease Cas1e [Gordonia sihwensis]KJR10506.1 hypothetical protein UG54_00475 [Gordonia sihwensis]